MSRMADSSEEQSRRRGPGRPFQPGESGIPAGSKPRDPELQALAREYSVPALRRIISIMESPATEDDTALRAANLIIERGYGKAPQKVEVENYDVMTDAELEKRIRKSFAEIRAFGWGHLLDEEPEEPSHEARCR
jgi:hypothetical protein